MAEEFDRTGKIGSKPSTVTRPGTRIIREWQGKIHEVCALETGFEYRNKQYGSLSEIARQITGTRWSGPAPQDDSDVERYSMVEWDEEGNSR